VAEAGGVEPHRVIHPTMHLSDAGQNRLASASNLSDYNKNSIKTKQPLLREVVFPHGSFLKKQEIAST
jgi:hypothetical protein